MADLALDGELRRSGASRSSGLLIVGALLGSAVSLAFNRLVAERLDDSTTNDIRAVLGGLSAIGFVSLGVQMAVIGVLGRGRDSHLTPSFERGGALIGAAFSVALGTGVATALVIESSSSFRLQSGFQVGLAVAAILVSCKPRAELLMNEQWGRLAILFVAGPSVRLAAAAWVLSESRPTFRLAPIVVAEVVTTILAFALRPKGVVGARTVPARQLLLGAVASAGLLAVLALSSFAVRARLGADADVFNSSATAARAVGFLPLTVSMIYFPRLARCAVGSRELRKAFVGATAWTVAIGGAAALALVVAPSLIVDFVAPSTHASESVVRLLSVAWAIHAVSLVALFVYIAHGSRFALAAWPIVVVIGLGQAAVGSAVQLGWLVLGSALLLAVAVTVPAFLRVQPILHARASTSRRVVRPGDVTLIVPCFNPGTAVVATIQQAAQVLTELSPNPAIIAVSDGSTDGSDDLIDQLDIMMLQHVRHETNRGKGPRFARDSPGPTPSSSHSSMPTVTLRHDCSPSCSVRNKSSPPTSCSAANNIRLRSSRRRDSAECIRLDTAG